MYSVSSEKTADGDLWIFFAQKTTCHGVIDSSSQSSGSEKIRKILLLDVT